MATMDPYTSRYLPPADVASEDLLNQRGQVLHSATPYVLHLEHGPGVPDEDLGATKLEGVVFQLACLTVK